MKIKQQGFSLLELLLTSGLSLLLLAGVFLVYVSSKKTYALSEALARMQENGRMATLWLRRDVQMAGYIGCARLTDVQPEGAAALDFSALTRIAGWHAGQTSSVYHALPATLLKQAVAGSDILLLQEMDPASKNILTATGADIKLQDTTAFNPGDILLISDCQHAEILRVATRSSTQLTAQTPLIHHYTDAAQIGHLHGLVYFIRKTDRSDPAGNPIYALYRRDLQASAHMPSELVEGVDDMQLTFNGMTADKVTDWQAVHNVQIALLLDSVDPVADYQKEYKFAGKTKLAVDRHLRREWDMTITLREPGR